MGKQSMGSRARTSLMSGLAETRLPFVIKEDVIAILGVEVIARR